MNVKNFKDKKHTGFCSEPTFGGILGFSVVWKSSVGGSAPKYGFCGHGIHEHPSKPAMILSLVTSPTIQII